LQEHVFHGGWLGPKGSRGNVSGWADKEEPLVAGCIREEVQTRSEESFVVTQWDAPLKEG
jgi:hypothetical protein